MLPGRHSNHAPAPLKTRSNCDAPYKAPLNHRIEHRKRVTVHVTYLSPKLDLLAMPALLDSQRLHDLYADSVRALDRTELELEAIPVGERERRCAARRRASNLALAAAAYRRAISRSDPLDDDVRTLSLIARAAAHACAGLPPMVAPSEFLALFGLAYLGRNGSLLLRLLAIETLALEPAAAAPSEAARHLVTAFQDFVQNGNRKRALATLRAFRNALAVELLPRAHALRLSTLAAIFDALLRGDAAALDDALHARERAITGPLASTGDRYDPATLLDVPALGLIELATKLGTLAPPPLQTTQAPHV